MWIREKREWNKKKKIKFIDILSVIVILLFWNVKCKKKKTSSSTYFLKSISIFFPWSFVRRLSTTCTLGNIEKPLATLFVKVFDSASFFFTLRCTEQKLLLNRCKAKKKLIEFKVRRLIKYANYCLGNLYCLKKRRKDHLQTKKKEKRYPKYFGNIS